MGILQTVLEVRTSLKIMLTSSFLFVIVSCFVAAQDQDECGPVKGKLGDKINDKCQEYTCTKNGDGTLAWEVTGVRDDCTEDRGRNRCKRPYGVEGDIFINDCIEYTCRSRGRRFKWKRERKERYEVCCAMNGTLYDRDTVMDVHYDQSGCPSMYLICDENGGTVMESNPDCSCQSGGGGSSTNAP